MSLGGTLIGGACSCTRSRVSLQRDVMQPALRTYSTHLTYLGTFADISNGLSVHNEPYNMASRLSYLKFQKQIGPDKLFTVDQSKIASPH